MLKKTLPGRTLFRGFLSVMVVSVFVGCGPPQDPHQSGMASENKVQPERDSREEDRTLVGSGSPFEKDSGAPEIENAPLATTREYVGPGPNLAYLEFLETLNNRYGTTIPSSTTQDPSNTDERTEPLEKKGEENEETRILAEDGYGIVDSGGGGVGSGD